MLGRRRTEEDLRRGLEDEWSPAGIRLMGLQKGGNIYIYIYIYIYILYICLRFWNSSSLQWSRSPLPCCG
jgi:hypothetical protein